MFAADGWAWIADTGDGYPAYVYTVGLTTTFGHPELVLVGLAPELSRQLIAITVERIRAGQRFTDGQVADRIATVPIVFRRVLDVQRDDHLFVAGLYNRDRAWSALQMFAPDARGRFPWDADVDPEYRRHQPLLYMPTQSGGREHGRYRKPPNGR